MAARVGDFSGVFHSAPSAAVKNCSITESDQEIPVTCRPTTMAPLSNGNLPSLQETIHKYKEIPEHTLFDSFFIDV